MAKTGPTWKFGSRRSDHEVEGVLVAYWEVSSDPISDDYTPDEISAIELFHMWAKRVKSNYGNGLIPIYWSVECQEQGVGVIEFMPFRFKHIQGEPQEDFLSFFTWPVNSLTGERLNWLALPVIDKRWNRRRADKGGFIQEVTKWKPAILQPYAFLPALESALL